MYPDPTMFSVLPQSHTHLQNKFSSVFADVSLLKLGLLNSRLWLCFRSSAASTLMHNDGDVT